jgi:predicted dehydrogenase
MCALGVGFIGAGRISDLHALAYLEPDSRARIVAVCDADPVLARQRAAAWGVPEAHIFTSYHELLALPEVQMVEILLPHHLHYQATLDVAAAGKHISVQKPMALTLEQAEGMITAARRAGIVLRVFENFIFYPPVQRARALIEAGEIGDPLTIRLKSNAGHSPNSWPVPRSAQAWRNDATTCGGGQMIFDDGHHKFALAWHFMGLAQEVHAWIGTTEVAPGVLLDAPAIVSWTLPGNRYGSFEVVYSPELLLETRHYAQDDRVEITGTKGVIWITRGHGAMLDVPPVVLYRDRRTVSYSDMPVGWEHSFINSTRHFVDALHDGATPCLTGEQGRDILRFALAAEESARLGRAVRL